MCSKHVWLTYVAQSIYSRIAPGSMLVETIISEVPSGTLCICAVNMYNWLCIKSLFEKSDRKHMLLEMNLNIRVAFRNSIRNGRSECLGVSTWELICDSQLCDSELGLETYMLWIH